MIFPLPGLSLTSFRHCARCLGWVFLLMLPLGAQAVGIDCQRARSASELTICGDAALLQADADVARRLAYQLKRYAHLATSLNRMQGDWLQFRDGCSDDVVCLAEQHRQRLKAMNEREQAWGEPPDAVDFQARDALLRAVTAWAQSDPEMPLYSHLTVLGKDLKWTDFSNEVPVCEADPDCGTEAAFPKRRPPGVSLDEWQAMGRSAVASGGENGMATYRLLDLDGDGRRDVVVDTYVGGTGLFNEVVALRRRGRGFVGQAVNTQAESQAAAQMLYSLNGRGANQVALWIRWQGRVYVAYVQSAFGADHLSLLRPFHPGGEIPVASIRYKYQFDLPRRPSRENRDVDLTDTQMEALRGPVARLNRWQEGSATVLPGPTECPVPEGKTSEDEGWWSPRGPGHYSFEIVADLPVWMSGLCLGGRVVDWFGGYAPGNGLGVQIWLPDDPATGLPAEVNLTARRSVVRVEPLRETVDTE